MNTEDNLSQAIDRAAKVQAREIQTKIKVAIEDAIKPFFRPNEAGGEFIGNDIKAILEWRADGMNKCDKPPLPNPSKELINYCRAKILTTLINGIPTFERILKLSKEQSDD